MLASRSAMLSLNSEKAGSRAVSGWEVEGCCWPALGVVFWDARREVREGGRRGVVGREGICPERVRECEALRGLGSVAGVVVAIVVGDVVVFFVALEVKLSRLRVCMFVEVPAKARDCCQALSRKCPNAERRGARRRQAPL